MVNRQIKIIAGLTGIVLGIGVLIYVLLDEDTSKAKKKKHEPTPKDVAVIPINKETIETPIEEKVIDTKVIDLHPIVEEKEQDLITEQVAVFSEDQSEEALFNFDEHDNYESELPEYFEDFQESATEIQTAEVETEEKLESPIVTLVQEKPKEIVIEEVPVIEQEESISKVAVSTPNEIVKVVNKEYPLIQKVTMSPRFPLKLGMKTEEVERLQIWLLRKFGAMAKVTKVFDGQTEELVMRCFDVKELDESTYQSLKIGAPLSKQKTTWQWKKDKEHKQER